MFRRIKHLFFKDSRVQSKSLKRILVITEDNPKEMTFFNRALRRANFDLLMAIDKVSGLEMALKHKPDIIILNSYLYGEKSIDLCLRLKENDLTKYIPLLMIAEKDDHSNIIEYYEKGIDLRGNLTKPISYRQLIREIDMIIKEKEC